MNKKTIETTNLWHIYSVTGNEDVLDL
jgi:hypothetical protein